MADAKAQIESGAAGFLQSVLTQPLYFQDNALALMSGLIISVLGGFKWFLPDQLQLANYEYSNYTYFMEEVVNGMVEKQSTITVRATRELSFINTYTLNAVTNNMLIKKFKEYTKSGGLFILITPIGIIDNLALEDLSVTFNASNPNPIFVFKFRKLIINSLNSAGFETDLSPRAAFCI